MDKKIIINYQILESIIHAENLDKYRLGYNIKRRSETCKPIIDFLVDQDQYLRNNVVVTQARHIPSGTYLSIYVSCKSCKEKITYKITLQNKPKPDEIIELNVLQIGDHVAEQHDVTPDRVTGDDLIQLAKYVR